MKYRKITEDLIEIIPGDLDVRRVLEMIARVSYETASTVPPWFVQPFDIPPDTVDFSTLIGDEGLKMDYLNGRLCSTYVFKKGKKYFLDAKRFREDRGSPEIFLRLVQARLQEIDVDLSCTDQPQPGQSATPLKKGGQGHGKL